MAFSATVGDRMDIRLYGRISGQTTISTFSYLADNGTGPVPINEVVNDWMVNWQAAGGLIEKFAACCPVNWEAWQIQFQLAKTAARMAAQTRSISVFGTSGAQARVPNVAAVILRRGDLASRDNVSTLHIPLAPDALLTSEGLVTAAFKTIAQDLIIKLDDLVSVTGDGNNLEWFPCIPHGPFAASNSPITEFLLKDTTRVMRRRTVGLGI